MSDLFKVLIYHSNRGPRGFAIILEEITNFQRLDGLWDADSPEKAVDKARVSRYDAPGSFVCVNINEWRKSEFKE